MKGDRNKMKTLKKIGLDYLKISIVVLILFTSNIAYSNNTFYGTSVFAGAGSSGEILSQTYIGTYLTDTISTRLELSLGEIFYMKGGVSSFKIGGSGLVYWDFFKVENLTFNAGVGIGIAHVPVTPDRYYRNLLYSSPQGLIHGRLGVRFPIHKKTELTVEYQWVHTSSLKRDDVGLNNHGIGIGLRW